MAKKSVFEVSDQVQCKPGCTISKDGYRFVSSNLEIRGVVLFFVGQTKVLIRGSAPLFFFICGL